MADLNLGSTDKVNFESSVTVSYTHLTLPTRTVV